MKKDTRLSVFAAICCIMIFNSCGKVANQLAQAITWQGIDVTVTIPAVPDTTYHSSMGTGTFVYNLDSFVKSKTGSILGMSNIDTFRFTTCTLTIQNPDAANNFANFQQAMAQFNTSTNPVTVNLGSIVNNPATYSATLSLPINNTSNLRSYLPTTGPVTINYTYAGKLRTATRVPLTVNLHVDYYIHVTQ